MPYPGPGGACQKRLHPPRCKLFMNKFYLIGWLVIFAQIGVLEYMAVRRPERYDTLSELIWLIMSAHPVIWFAATGALIWAFIHFVTRGRV